MTGLPGLDAETPNAAPANIAPDEPLIVLPECDGAFVSALISELGLHPFLAQTLVRRGVRSVQEASLTLGVEELVDPALLPGVGPAADAIVKHLRADSRIAVHGDYDVDGVCSTSILVKALSGLGADVTWHVPSRFDEGYGLSVKAIDQLAADGVDLIVTVDCGVGSVAEVLHAKALGIDVVICDHHKPGAELPDAPIVHPGLGDYPTPDLCAAATTFKLAQVVTGLVGGDVAALDSELELVALATVCDVVPLVGENRALVVKGIELMRTTTRPGLIELMRSAGTNQLNLNSRSFGFALGPRINAAGRMYSAEPAVELMLTSSHERAAELAEHLEGSNFNRRAVGKQVLHQAEAQARQQLDRFAIIVAGEGWHAGVLGIVAGRLAESYRRPVLALGIENGVAAGSGRNGGVFDLHGGLEACSEHLVRFGGHRAAAGLELDVASLPAFIRDFSRVAAGALTVDDLRPRFTVDAIAEPSQISISAVQQLDRLGPYGHMNPEPLVLLPSVQVESARKMGDGAQHRNFSVSGRGGSIGVIAFGWERAELPTGDESRLNMLVELSLNEFRGNVEPQAQFRAAMEVPPHDEGAWIEEFNATFEAQAYESAAGVAVGIDRELAIDRTSDSPMAVIAESAAKADRTVLVVNNIGEWRPVVDALAAIDSRLAALRVVAYDNPGLASIDADHLILVEPPPAPDFTSFGDIPVTIAWNEATARITAGRGADLLLARNHAVELFRVVRAGSGKPFAEVAPQLRSALPSARVAARATQALHEISMLRVDRNGSTVEAIHAVDSAKSDLELSPTFRSYSAYREDSERWLRQLTEQQSENP